MEGFISRSRNIIDGNLIVRDILILRYLLFFFHQSFVLICLMDDYFYEISFFKIWVYSFYSHVLIRDL